MSCLTQGKKVLPTKKPWKGFISKLQKSKLHQFSQSKAFKTTTHCLDTVLHHINPLFPPKPHSLTKHSIPELRYCHHHRPHPDKEAVEFVAKKDLELHENIQANETDEPSCENEAKTAGLDMQQEQNSSALDQRSKNASLDESKAATSMLLQLHPVDARAEEFINKIQRHLRLEREESLERSNYYAMWPHITYFDPIY